ncbi:pyridoxamine 5'-phosphate oxidase family protein [Jatrophihabitans endophyticus]|uniref:pyridoxamine 5'-phosphate oxidase family protein n=1 Tax=Jatrophihabitans endophyticus TaxID=1206085 RepID=UPI0019DC9E23|nr:pyridoxamine 5'-phosphate oxidase family protein [Jatrophihabitans endophyticus]MBE7187118.1 pyridoxamine 5'-phosphate oxidase family protein [Jatrophihabitans endophyticus]
MADDLRPQRRGRRIAMSDAERDDFLRAARTCRVATTGPEGPHATPLWFVWDGSDLWLYSIVRSQRWTDLERDPRIGVVVDTGEDYLELRGVEIAGRVEVVGDVPRVDTPDATLEPVEALFAEKYAAGQMGHDGRHGWLRVRPSKITSWDFRKLAG